MIQLLITELQSSYFPNSNSSSIRHLSSSPSDSSRGTSHSPCPQIPKTHLESSEIPEYQESQIKEKGKDIREELILTVERINTFLKLISCVTLDEIFPSAESSVAMSSFPGEERTVFQAK